MCQFGPREGKTLTWQILINWQKNVFLLGPGKAGIKPKKVGPH